MCKFKQTHCYKRFAGTTVRTTVKTVVTTSLIRLLSQLLSQLDVLLQQHHGSSLMVTAEAYSDHTKPLHKHLVQSKTAVLSFCACDVLLIKCQHTTAEAITAAASHVCRLFACRPLYAYTYQEYLVGGVSKSRLELVLVRYTNCRARCCLVVSQS
jgi:hypothetical protein